MPRNLLYPLTSIYTPDKLRVNMKLLELPVKVTYEDVAKAARQHPLPAPEYSKEYTRQLRKAQKLANLPGYQEAVADILSAPSPVAGAEKLGDLHDFVSEALGVDAAIASTALLATTSSLHK